MLVIQDDFTKYVISRPLRRATGPKIYKVLKDYVFAVFSHPAVVHTDNGTEFINNFMEAELAERGIEHTTIPYYHAQAHPTERANRTIKTMIFLENDQQLWGQLLSEFAFAMNNAKQDSTVFSPFFLNFGRNPPVCIRNAQDQVESG